MIKIQAFHATKGFYEWLKNSFYPKITSGNTDGVIVVCGAERSGKSEWCLRTAYDLHKEQFFKDGNICVENICMDGRQYRNRLSNAQMGDVVIFDEAGTAMYSRDAMTPETKKINKKLMVCGYKNLLHFLCLPDFFSIDKNIRKHRVKLLIKITERGKFLIYNKKKALKIGMEGSWNAATTSARGWWGHNDRDEDFIELEKAYRAKEKKYKDAFMAEGADDDDDSIEEKKKLEPNTVRRTARVEILASMLKKKNLSKKEISRLMGMSYKWVRMEAKILEKAKSTLVGGKAL